MSGSDQEFTLALQCDHISAPNPISVQQLTFNVQYELVSVPVLFSHAEVSRNFTVFSCLC